jgi:hypothetical protein
MTQMWPYILFFAILIILGLVSIGYFSRIIHVKKLIKQYGTLLMTLCMPIAGSLSIWIIVEAGNEKVESVERALNSKYSKYVSYTDSLKLSFDMPFAFMQASKIEDMFSEDFYKPNPVKINNYENLSIVSPGSLCNVTIYDIWTGNNVKFPLQQLFYTKIDSENFNIRVLIRELDRNGLPITGWSEKQDLLNCCESKRGTEYYIPVKPQSNLRIRVDTYKSGWPLDIPVSFTGVDTREYKNPPNKFDFWLFFKKDPLLIEKWAFDKNEIVHYEKKRLISALVNHKNSICAGLLEKTNDIPDNTIFDLKPGFYSWIDSCQAVRYHFSFLSSEKDFYGASFLQFGTLVNNPSCSYAFEDSLLH